MSAEARLRTGAPSRDPRPYQIAVLFTLLVYGMARLDFDIGLVRVALILTAVLLTQFIFGRIWKLGPRLNSPS